MLKTFGALVVEGNALAESAPVWLESTRQSASGETWAGTILLAERPKLAHGSQMVLLLEDGRQAEVVLDRMHPGVDGGMLVRFKSTPLPERAS
ncbi:MAG TPA: hypothetical protein VHY20_13765 [Pirellulales bacterium]|nr:hypothetical protein [Pirellulales bacterium]